MQFTASDSSKLFSRTAQVFDELAHRLPAKPWSELQNNVPAGTLDGFGGPSYPKWQVAVALVRDGTLYYKDPATPYGPYPYPLEMRFGVHSVTKSVFVPLALLRLAEVYGPWVLALKIGDYVPGLASKWQRVRFIDAANMATGFGGAGSTKTHPNDMLDGYRGGNYFAWDNARSHADKVKQITANLRAYPWEPGTVMRYSEQDYYVLGAAIDSFLKSVRGQHVNLGGFLQSEVFTPIGVYQAPLIKTREPAGRDGIVWCHAGYYPTLDDLAKIALLYQARGTYRGVQILHRDLTSDLMTGRGAIVKTADASLSSPVDPPALSSNDGLFKMGFHFLRYVTEHGSAVYLPYMHSSGNNDVMLYPNQMASIVITNASVEINGLEKTQSDDETVTMRVVERLSPF